MKSFLQNILAKNSSGTLDYVCGKCGKFVEKEATVCPHCNAKLGNIRCPFCSFTGDLDAFKYDTCPRCGRKRSNSNTKQHRSHISNTNPNRIISKREFLFLLAVLSLSLIGLIWIFLVYFEFI